MIELLLLQTRLGRVLDAAAVEPVDEPRTRLRERRLGDMSTPLRELALPQALHRP